MQTSLPFHHQHQIYRGHSFVTEAVGADDSWQGRHRIDFMRGGQMQKGHTLGARWAVPLESTWATPAEALAYATEQAYAAIDAYARLKDEAVARPDSGLRDQRLVVRYSLLAEDGVEKQQEFFSAPGALQFIERLGDSLAHAVVLDAAGTTLIEAGNDYPIQHERPNHADWPQTA